MKKRKPAVTLNNEQHTRLKILAATAGISMQDLVNEYINRAWRDYQVQLKESTNVQDRNDRQTTQVR